MKKIICSILTTLTLSLFCYSQTSVPPSKGTNIYEFVGSNHNSLLQSFFLDYSPNRVKEEKLSLNDVTNYLIVKSGVKEKELVENVFSNPIYQICRTTKLSDLPNKLVQLGAVSQPCADYIKSINTLIENELEIGFESLNNKAILLENSIQQDPVLKETEKGILLCAVATARYSAYFWKEFSENMDMQTKGNSSSARLPGWLNDLIAADVSGAVGGGAIGAAVGGTATLGTATLPAWVVGAITGGAGNSISSGVTSIWNYFF